MEKLIIGNAFFLTLGFMCAFKLNMILYSKLIVSFPLLLDIFKSLREYGGHHLAVSNFEKSFMCPWFSVRRPTLIIRGLTSIDCKFLSNFSWSLAP